MIYKCGDNDFTLSLQLNLIVKTELKIDIIVIGNLFYNLGSRKSMWYPPYNYITITPTLTTFQCLDVT